MQIANNTGNYPNQYTADVIINKIFAAKITSTVTNGAQTLRLRENSSARPIVAEQYSGKGSYFTFDDVYEFIEAASIGLTNILKRDE